MSLQIRYNRVTTAGGVDPDHIAVRQGVSFSSSAEEGSVAMSQIIVDDTANALDYVGRRRVYAFETACQAHNQIIYNGYLQTRTIGRRPAEGQDNDEEVMGRRWVLNIGDTNSLLSRRLITGADGDRPAETDVARIQWLLDSNNAYLSNPQDNWENPSPYVDTNGPVSMSAANYIGRTAFDVLNDCAQRSGKNWFVRYYEANDTVPPTNAGSYALWYAKANSTLDTSTLRLTNVNADVDDATTFAVMPDALLSRDPTRAYSGSYLTYDGGSRYDQSTNVVNLFQRQDAAVNNPFVKTDTEAGALNARYLTDAETEDDRLTCEFVVDKQYVNDLREGQRFEGKFSHFTTASGTTYSDWTWWRCLRRTVTHLNDEQYRIGIEATPLCTAESIIRQSTYTPLTTTTVTFPAPTIAGHLMLAWITSRDANFVGHLQPGWTQLGSTVQAVVNASGPDDGRWVYVEADGSTTYDFTGSPVNSMCIIWELDFPYASFNPADVTLYETTLHSASTNLNLGAVAAPIAGQLILYGSVYDTQFTPDIWATAGAGWTMTGNGRWGNGFADQHPFFVGMAWDGTTTPLTGNATIGSAMPYGGVMLQFGDGCP